jgi:hypothetical protein
MFLKTTSKSAQLDLPAKETAYSTSLRYEMTLTVCRARVAMLRILSYAYRLDDSPPTFSYRINSQLGYSTTQVTTVALIKRAGVLDPTTPLATQIHVLNLFGGEDTPYESLHAVVSAGVKPWFEAFVGSRGGGKDGDSKMGSFSYDSRRHNSKIHKLNRYSYGKEEVR